MRNDNDKAPGWGETVVVGLVAMVAAAVVIWWIGGGQ